MGPKTKVRVRTGPPDPRDRLARRQTEPVGSVVPRFGLRRPVGGRPWAPDAVDQPLRQKTCRWCDRLVAICAACARGHAYGTARCRTQARRRSVQRANARHPRSPEGRLDHRDHQRASRARQGVRDQSSPAVLRYARLHVLDVAAPAPAPLRCVVCGRASRWLIPARWPRVDRRRGADHARAARRDPAPLFRRALEDRDPRRRPRGPP